MSTGHGEDVFWRQLFGQEAVLLGESILCAVTENNGALIVLI